jgi:hypothetical protein
MIILLRGHVRNSFENDNLYNLIKELNNKYSISIYIHTWHIKQSKLSWREMDEVNSLITTDLINNYFKDISHLIKLIIIDNDSIIKKIGNLEGNIMNTNCPIKGWKNLWYGNYKIINYIQTMNNDDNIVIMNMRFDIFNNSNNLSYDEIINFIDNTKNNNFHKNYFIEKDNLFGVDNIFIGNIDSMTYLLNNLYLKLDDILEKFKFLDLRCQEHYVYYENCLGKNFDIFVYKVMNNLDYMNNNQLLDHWIHYGRYENKICTLPKGFNYDYYRIANNILDWNDKQVITHWYNHGQYQNWMYKLPDNFNFNVYKIFNNVHDWTHADIIWHWYNHGYKQGWVIGLPNNLNIHHYRILHDLTHYDDYNVILHLYNFTYET